MNYTRNLKTVDRIKLNDFYKITLRDIFPRIHDINWWISCDEGTTIFFLFLSRNIWLTYFNILYEYYIIWYIIKAILSGIWISNDNVKIDLIWFWNDRNDKNVENVFYRLTYDVDHHKRR